uniref:Uncharacterized protein n=1 Tax=Setaria italica TaxID=4555 RepID=K3Y007_SETIT
MPTYCCLYLVANFCPLQLAEHTAEQQKCRQTSALAGFVSSFLSSVYWSLSQLATASAHLFALHMVFSKEYISPTVFKFIPSSRLDLDCLKMHIIVHKFVPICSCRLPYKGSSQLSFLSWFTFF